MNMNIINVSSMNEHHQSISQCIVNESSIMSINESSSINEHHQSINRQ